MTTTKPPRRNRPRLQLERWERHCQPAIAVSVDGHYIGQVVFSCGKWEARPHWPYGPISTHDSSYLAAVKALRQGAQR